MDRLRGVEDKPHEDGGGNQPEEAGDQKFLGQMLFHHRTGVLYPVFREE
jgi:hypothetical protein